MPWGKRDAPSGELQPSDGQAEQPLPLRPFGRRGKLHDRFRFALRIKVAVHPTKM